MKRIDYPTRKDWIRTMYYLTYILITFAILISAIYHIINIPGGVPDKTITESKVEAEQEPTFTQLIIEPLTKSDKTLVIIEHLGYFLLLLFVFILLPIPLERMKRFKLLNFEIEIDSRAEVVANNLTTQHEKFNFITYLLKEDSKRKLLEIEMKDSRYICFLNDMLEIMRVEYQDNWNTNIDYQILTEAEFHQQKIHIPSVVRKSLEVARIHGNGLPINKENDRHIHFKNYMIHAISVRENIYTDSEIDIDYIVVLSCHRSIFDDNDSHVVSGISSIAEELYQRYNIMLAFQDNMIDFTTKDA